MTSPLAPIHLSHYDVTIQETVMNDQLVIEASVNQGQSTYEETFRYPLYPISTILPYSSWFSLFPLENDLQRHLWKAQKLSNAVFQFKTEGEAYQFATTQLEDVKDYVIITEPSPRNRIVLYITRFNELTQPYPIQSLLGVLEVIAPAFSQTLKAKRVEQYWKSSFTNVGPLFFRLIEKPGNLEQNLVAYLMMGYPLPWIIEQLSKG